MTGSQSGFPDYPQLFLPVLEGPAQRAPQGMLVFPGKGLVRNAAAQEFTQLVPAVTPFNIYYQQIIPSLEIVHDFLVVALICLQVIPGVVIDEPQIAIKISRSDEGLEWYQRIHSRGLGLV